MTDTLRALLKEGCGLLSVEVDALKAGITIFATGDLSADPEDAQVVATINDIEDWIKRAGEAIAKEKP